MRSLLIYMLIIGVLDGCSSTHQPGTNLIDGVYTCSLSSNKSVFVDFSVLIDGDRFFESSNMFSTT